MTKEIQQHETSTSLVIAPPAELDAGSDMVLKVRVLCAAGCTLDGQLVRIIDQDGALVKEIEIASSDAPSPDETTPVENAPAAVVNETAEFVVKSPTKPGEHTWAALFPAQEKEGLAHQESSAPFSFIVKPHKTSMTVWDVPSPVVLGGKFKIKAGVLCSVGCKLTSKKIQIFDARGSNVGTASLSQEPWSNAGPMYWAEVELEAPAEQQVYDWTAKFSRPAPEMASPEDLEHEESAYPFAFATTRAPDHVVRLEVIDKEQRTPVPNADVALFPEGGFPYRTRTDALGTASLNVSKGHYEIYVALMDYENYKTTAEVDSDVTIQAEFVYHPDLGG